ncbi:MAG: hypothetical protein HY908_24065 [Myxococcales bacterium]|nr:hypothetical protein [Myxococcales bacterium]
MPFLKGSIGGERGEEVANLPGMCLGAGERAVGFGIAEGNVCVLLDSGDVKCFGAGFGGMRGSEDWSDGWCGAVEPVRLGKGRKAVAIASHASAEHTCVILDDGHVKCWGHNNNGQLGIDRGLVWGVRPGDMGDSLPYVDLGADRTARSISTGPDMSCAVLDNGQLKCWGDMLRRGLDPKLRGAGGGFFGGGDPAPEVVDLGVGRTAVAVACGGLQTCVILDTGDVKCWGVRGRHCGFMPACGGKLIEGYPSPLGDALPVVPLPRKARAISATFTKCAILEDDTLWCWGTTDAQLGIGRESEESSSAVPVVLGAGRTVRLMAVGLVHTCAVLDDESLKCWGWGGPWLGTADGAHRDRGGTPDTVPALLPPIDVGE